MSTRRASSFVHGCDPGRRRRAKAVRAAAVAVLVVVAAVGATGCGVEDGTTGGAHRGAGPNERQTLRGNVVVSAAASLTDVFEELADRFERAHPGVRVDLDAGSSTALATRILEGAPADVFASADPASMERVESAGLVERPHAFAGNELAIVTRPGNPHGITGLADLAGHRSAGGRTPFAGAERHSGSRGSGEGVGVGIVALCAESAPCGRYTAALLERSGVTIPEGSITRGQDARATLAAVAEGDAAAGVVYRSDARAAGDRVATVDIAGADAVRAEYLIAAVRNSRHRDVARSFVDLVRSDEGRSLLEDAGFTRP